MLRKWTNDHLRADRLSDFVLSAVDGSKEAVDVADVSANTQLVNTQLASLQLASVDARGRMSFPAVFRNKLGDLLYLTRDVDDKGCIIVYSEQGYSEFCKSMREGLTPHDASLVMTYIGSVTHMVEPDKMGRITVPEDLCNYAGMTCGTAAVVGSGEYAEIWDKVRYDQFAEKNNDLVRAMILQKRKQMPTPTEG